METPESRGTERRASRFCAEGSMPWLASIDPDTGAPRRRVARLSEIPPEARPLIDLLVEQRLLSTDVAKGTGEATIEPAHEALLRQWGLLQGWLKEDAGLLTILDGIKRASRDWAANNKASSWLAHGEERLRAAQRLLARPDLAANLEPTDKNYVSACVAAERTAQSTRRRAKVLVGALALSLAAAGLGWWQERWVREQYHWRMVLGGKALTSEEGTEIAAQPKAEFRECRTGCPIMVVVSAGTFLMGASQGGDQHEVRIGKTFAVGKYEVTFTEWDACVAVGACPEAADLGWGRGDRPVINVSWEAAKQYVNWLSRATGHDYRLLTEAEWEYAARAGSAGSYSFRDSADQLDQYAWYHENSERKTQPVGTKKPNAFGLHDMHGNVEEWVEDYWHPNLRGAPADGSPWVQNGDAKFRVIRGGSWRSYGFVGYLTSAYRNWHSAEFKNL